MDLGYDKPAFALSDFWEMKNPPLHLALRAAVLRRVKERWQSWFNAPDSKSDVLSKVPGVRIPLSPHYALLFPFGT